MLYISIEKSTFMKKSILLIPLVMAATISIRAQSIGPSTLNAAGGSAVIGSNEFDWSVGEMTMVSTFTTPGIIVTQGVLQPYDPPSLGAGNTSLLTTHLQVFPNPATSEVNLEYSSASAGTLNYRLMDIAGKIIFNQTIKVNQGTTLRKIDVSGLACATYMLEVVVNPENTSSQTASYKIQKLK